MASIIRLKRPSNENPVAAVLLNCKRAKTDDSDSSTVFKLTGTNWSKEDDVFRHIKLNKYYRIMVPTITEKLREEIVTKSKDLRWKVVNSFRNKPHKPSSCTIFDIDQESDSNSNPETEYVYDVYYGGRSANIDGDLNEMLSVYPLSDYTIYNLDLPRDSDSDDSEDSNAESNARNDYPDESDSNSEDDDGFVRAMNRVALHGNDLSSDEDNEIGNEYDKFKATHSGCTGESNNEYDSSCTP